MKKLFILVIIINLILLIGVLCKPSQKTEQEPEYVISIINPHFPTYDFTREICKNIPSIKNELLIKPGTEVHSFDPSPANIRTLQKADLCFIIGGESDFWIEEILATLNSPALTVISLFEELHIESHLHHESEEQHNHSDFETDEHLWTSPTYAQEIVTILSKEIQNTFAKKAEEANIPQSEIQQTLVTIKQNTALYISKIQELSFEFETIIKNSSNNLIVMGDRFPFAHFAEEFDLHYKAAFDGCSTAVETNPTRLAELITTIQNNRLPAVFHIEMSNKKIAAIIAESCNVPLLELHSMQNVTREEFENGETYLSLMKKNASNLEKGLPYDK